MNHPMIPNRQIILLLAVSALTISSSSQQSNKKVQANPLQLAEQYFAAGEYYTAAHLYGQYLNPPKKQKEITEFPLNIKARRAAINENISRADILFKQAESFRLANYWKEAAAAYKECMKEPAMYNDALYWYAVCERSLGHYNSARQNLEQYLNNSVDDKKYKDAAEKELQIISFIQQQLVRPDSILFTITKLESLNSHETGAFAPVQLNGRQFLISSTERSPAQVNDGNPYHSRLFIATVNKNKLDDLMPLNIPVSDQMVNYGAASISPGGDHLYFTQWKKENGKTVSAIYYSAKQMSGWSSPMQVTSIHLNGYNTKQPFCTADGKYLFFASDRPGGMGGFDIWYAPLHEDGTTGEPVNAGAVINTNADEQAPFYHSNSNTLVFSSNGRHGMGGFDLFAAKGNVSDWKTPENMGHPVNSQKDDVYFFAPEQTSLLSTALVSSDRGDGCCLETYRITKAPKNKMLTGLVMDCDENAPLANAEIILTDAVGKTWTTTTSPDGRYSFETGNGINTGMAVIASKELYYESLTSLNARRTDETDLLTDLVINSDICLQKIPEPKAEEPEPLVIKAEDVVTVFFDFDRSALKQDASIKLDSIYQVMVDNPTATIQISGYTDGLGSEMYNAKLSHRRAKACADYLVRKGINASRVSFVSFGKCCPVEMEIINGRDNPDGRSKNRRALMNVKKD
jgi:OOP family OmpA-OmpF porin